ncbi:hypothetical protein TruAng_005621 [Truncatella angustata]|nr:hypothetical protein TruAng_005621 [Truncatella angustata]
MDSSSLASSRAATTSIISSTQLGTVLSYPDYSIWNAEAFERYPGYLNAHSIAKEHVWWWSYGFRLQNGNRESIVFYWLQEIEDPARATGPILVSRPTGINIADEIIAVLEFYGIEKHIIAVLEFYGIEKHVGFCTLDNESKNGTCMIAIGQHLKIDCAKRQISCAPHSLQLAARALMYGDGCKRLNLDNLLLHLNQDPDQDEDEFLRGVFRRATDMADAHDIADKDDDAADEDLEDALVEQWHRAQKEIQPDKPVLEWVYNNATRWQSDYAMIERALTKKLATNRLMNTLHENWDAAGAKTYDRPPILEYRLGDADWVLVEAVHKILQPFAVASTLFQGTGEPTERAIAGGFDKYFPQIETLLDYLEMRALPGLAEMFDAEPERQHPTWRDVYTKKLNTCWQDNYKNRDILVPNSYTAGNNTPIGWIARRAPAPMAPNAEPVVLPMKLTGFYTQSATYAGRALAEWGLVIAECNNFINRRRKGVLGLSKPATKKKTRGRGPKSTTKADNQPQDELAVYLMEPLIDMDHYHNDPIAWWRDDGS